jgi:hypothetical protein
LLCQRASARRDVLVIPVGDPIVSRHSANSTLGRSEVKAGDELGLEPPIAKDCTSCVDARIAGKVRERSARFLDDDGQGAVIPWTAPEQDDCVENPSRDE